jgi:hypothetical protein
MPTGPMVLDAQAEFRRLIAMARVLPARFETEVVGDGEVGLVSPNDFPAWTALRRAHWAADQYQPAVAVLGDDRTVHGSMLLLRGLLELWAEFLYLTDNKDPAERRIRAIEIEIDVARQLTRTLQIPGMAAPIDAGRSFQVAKDRLDRLEKIKRDEKWKSKGGRYTYGHVANWLGKTGLDWPTLM